MERKRINMNDDSSIKIKDLTKQVKILKKLIKDMNKQMIEDKQKVFPLLAKVSNYVLKRKDFNG